jgi:septal ring factor EnvC (AmiA/AmiB activator)
MLNKIFATLIFFLCAIAALAQEPTKDQLEKQRAELRKEIQATEKALIETQRTTKVNVGQLSLINKKLNLQDNVIRNISGEIQKLGDNIYLSFGCKIQP